MAWRPPLLARSCGPEMSALAPLLGDKQTFGERVRNDAIVQGFGCRPMEMVQLAPGPASESRQRTNPRVMCAEGAALNYGDFAAGSGLLRLD